MRDLHALSSYLPSCVVEYLVCERASGTRIAPPETQTFNTVCLFADVSGFTALSEALLGKLGPRDGAEMLAKHLNNYTTMMVKLTARGGGDVQAALLHEASMA